MSGFKEISVYPDDEGVYLFEFTDNKKKGVFIPELTTLSVGETVTFKLYGEDGKMLFQLIGKIEWQNKVEDLGVGIVFLNITNEMFSQSKKIIGSVAYI